MIAALYVEKGGCYFGLPHVDPWDEARDARLYAGPHPVVAHPPCARWGRYSEGGPSSPRRYKTGDDGGCFEAALHAVGKWGGVLEHPAHSKAWDHFAIGRPAQGEGWLTLGNGWYTCEVEQGHYGHEARKRTWLLVRTGAPLPELNWAIGEQRLLAHHQAREGYEYARRRGVLENMSKNRRLRTPPEFRDLLIAIAEEAR